MVLYYFGVTEYVDNLLMANLKYNLIMIQMNYTWNCHYIFDAKGLMPIFPW